MRCRVTLLTMGSLLLTTVSATAQPVDTHAMADDEFRQGREAYTKQDYKRALDLFRASHEFEPGKGKLLNIAICEEQIGELANALKHFEEVASQLPEEDDRLPIARQHIAQIEPKVARLRIDLATGSPPGTRVTIDDVPVLSSALSTDIPVEAGKHIVSVIAPNLPDRRYPIPLEEGKRATLSVEPGTPPPSPSPVVTLPPKPTVTLSPAPLPVTMIPTTDTGRSVAPGIALIALGATGLGVGATFVGLRQKQLSDTQILRSALLSTGKTCASGKPNFGVIQCQSLAASTAQSDTFGTVSVAAFAAGGLATMGALTYFLWPTPRHESSLSARIYFAPITDATHRGVLLWGSF